MGLDFPDLFKVSSIQWKGAPWPVSPSSRCSCFCTNLCIYFVLFHVQSQVRNPAFGDLVAGFKCDFTCCTLLHLPLLVIPINSARQNYSVRCLADPSLLLVLWSCEWTSLPESASQECCESTFDWSCFDGALVADRPTSSNVVECYGISNLHPISSNVSFSLFNL